MDRLYPYVVAAGLAGLISVAGLLALSSAARRERSKVRAIRVLLREEAARSPKGARDRGAARRARTP